MRFAFPSPANEVAPRKVLFTPRLASPATPASAYPLVIGSVAAGGILPMLRLYSGTSFIPKLGYVIIFGVIDAPFVLWAAKRVHAASTSAAVKLFDVCASHSARKISLSHTVFR